jgi:hypothetical protein
MKDLKNHVDCYHQKFSNLIETELAYGRNAVDVIKQIVSNGKTLEKNLTLEKCFLLDLLLLLYKYNKLILSKIKYFHFTFLSHQATSITLLPSYRLTMFDLYFLKHRFYLLTRIKIIRFNEEEQTDHLPECNFPLLIVLHLK